MNFLLDNNLPPSAAEALDAIYRPEGHRIYHLRKLFPPDIEDVDWIRQAPEHDIEAVVTSDRAIRRVRQEREAWLKSGLTVFFLKKGWQNLSGLQINLKLVFQWSEIIRLASHRRHDRGYLVPVGGKKFDRVTL